MSENSADIARWLEHAQRDGTSTRSALRMFDAAPTVRCDELRGQWRGHGLRTGHPLDGALESLGWYGKRFDDGADAAFPLLFHGRTGPVAVDPRWLPVRTVLRTRAYRSPLVPTVFRRIGPMLRTQRPSARLRMMEFRGRATATMIYDAHPINDVFRRIDDSRVLGLMDCRYLEAPFFFVLARDPMPAG